MESSLATPGEFQRWNFKNSVKLNLKKLERPVNHQTIFQQLKCVLKETEFKQVTAIYNFSSNKIWIVKFQQGFVVSNLFERPIEVNGVMFKLEDANKLPDQKKYSIFRFHFLPEDFNKELLRNYFDATKINGLKVEEISEETYRNSCVKNGVKRVKVSYPKESTQNVYNLTGPTLLYRLKCVISIVGQKQKCFFCNEESHNIAKCPVKNQACRSCNQKGHLTEKCSLAERLKAIERAKIDYSDLAIQEEEAEICQYENDTNVIISIPITPVYQQNESMNSHTVPSTESSPKSMHTPVLPPEFRKNLEQTNCSNVEKPQTQAKKSLKTTFTQVQTRIQIKRQSESESQEIESEKRFKDQEENEDLSDHNDVFQERSYAPT